MPGGYDQRLFRYSLLSSRTIHEITIDSTMSPTIILGSVQLTPSSTFNYTTSVLTNSPVITVQGDLHLGGTLILNLAYDDDGARNAVAILDAQGSITGAFDVIQVHSSHQCNRVKEYLLGVSMMHQFLHSSWTLIRTPANHGWQFD